MAPKERISAGCIFFAYKNRPSISTKGSITGSTKDVVSMEWLNADDLSIEIGRPNPAPSNETLAPFMCLSVHERHLVGLPLVKVPYTMTYNKTCELAERVDRTYLAVSPTENTTRLPSKRYDRRFRALDGTGFPVQKIYKDPKTGKNMDEWDTYIDLLNTIIIHVENINWYGEIFKASVPETLRFIRLFRFVHGLEPDIADEAEIDEDGLPIDLETRDRTIKRPVEIIGPGVQRWKKEDDKDNKGKGAQRSQGGPRSPPSPPYTGTKRIEAQQKAHADQVPEAHPTNVQNAQTPAGKPTWAQLAAMGEESKVDSKNEPNVPSPPSNTGVTSGGHSQPTTGNRSQPTSENGKGVSPSGGNNNYGGNHSGNNYGGGYRGRGSRNRGNRGYQGRGRGGNRGGGGGHHNYDGNGRSPDYDAGYRNRQGGGKQGNNHERGFKQPAGTITKIVPRDFITAPTQRDIRKSGLPPPKPGKGFDNFPPPPGHTPFENPIVYEADAGRLGPQPTGMAGVPSGGCPLKECNFDALILAIREEYRQAELDMMKNGNENQEDYNTHNIIDCGSSRTTWNKERSAIIKEPWPSDWKKLELGERMIEGLERCAQREGWNHQVNRPWWHRSQDWLGLEGRLLIVVEHHLCPIGN
ncbi:hypothetical protein ABW19_dt0205153 [Dactylella cylindrospora]|nr:hypothetical protein ABW19_dt0205153 [Dactylella cylindrospora]